MLVTVKTSTGNIISKHLDSDKAVVGRSPKSDVVVPDEHLSRSHCLIEMVSGTFYITDLGSANGVFIDGERIRPNTRIIYNNFSQLSIGHMECTIEDLENVEETQAKSVIGLDTEDKKPTKRQDKDRERVLLKTTPKKAKLASRISAMGLIAGLILAGAIYYQTSHTNEEIKDPSTSNESFITQKPKAINLAADEFKLPSEYQELNGKKNCIEKPEFCENLKLDPSLHEGLVFLTNEVILFINTSRKLEEQKYQTLKDSKEIGDLIAMEMLLSSELLNQYVLGNIGQIHMVLNSADGMPYKVYRIHPTKFLPSAAPRIDMITTLASAFVDSKTEKFWTLITPFMLTLTIQQ